MKNHANIAAAHSTPTMLAVVTLRRRKRRSGINGCAIRASMARKSAKSATAAESRISVWPDRQPASLPLTMAYTASRSDEVTVTAPHTSSRGADVRAPSGAMSFMQRMHTAAPMGRLTRKIQCQLNALVSRPPSSTPRLPPPAHTNP